MQAEIEFDKRDNIVMKINNHKIVLEKDILFRQNYIKIKIDDSDFFPLPVFHGEKPTEKIFNAIHQGDEKTINMLKIASVAFLIPQRTINIILGVGEKYNTSYKTKIKELYRSVVRAFQRKIKNNWKVDSEVKYVKSVLEDLGEEKLSNKLWSWWLATKFKS